MPMKNPNEAPKSVVTKREWVRKVGENAKNMRVRNATGIPKRFLVQWKRSQPKNTAKSRNGIRAQKIIASASFPDSYKNVAPCVHWPFTSFCQEGMSVGKFGRTISQLENAARVFKRGGCSGFKR